MSQLAVEKYLKGGGTAILVFLLVNSWFAYFFVCFNLAVLVIVQLHKSSQESGRSSLSTYQICFCGVRRRMSPTFQLLTDSFTELLINAIYCKELCAVHGYYFFLFNPISTAQVGLTGHRFLTAKGGAPVMEAVNNSNYFRWTTKLL